MEDPFSFQSENSAHSGVTCGCSDEAEYCTYNDRRIHNGFTRNSIQRPSIRNLLNSPVRHRNQFSLGSTRDSKLVTGGIDYVHSVSSQKQVTLYKWYLIRVVKDCSQNGIIDDEEQVAVGGYTTPDMLDCEKFRTAPIESRIEKCKLRTVDGLDVLLMGTIDEQCTNDNGFPFQVIHLFLHGFPFNWNHIISISNRKPSLNMHILPASNTEDCASWGKLEKPESECPVGQVDGTETGKSSLLEQEKSLSKADSRRESSLRHSKRVRHKSQPAKFTKKSICCKLSTEDKPEKHFTVVESQEKSYSLKESEANLCSGAPNKSLKEEALAHFKTSDMDSHVQRVKEDKFIASGKEFVGSQDNPNILKGTEANLSPGAASKFVEKKAPRLQSSNMDSDVQVWTDSGCEVRRTKSPNFSAFHVGRGPVETEKNVSGKYKSKYFKKQIDGGSSHAEAKLLESTGTAKIKENNTNQTIGKLPNSKGDTDNRTANQEVEQSSWNNVHLEQLIDNCTTVEELPQSHISEFGDIGSKRRGRPSKSVTNSRIVYSPASGDNQEIKQSSQNKVHLEQLINSCTPVERTLESEIPISEFAVTGSKGRREILSKPNTRRNRNSRNAYSEASRDILCDEASVMDGRKNNSDVKNMICSEELHQDITPTWPLDKACKGTDEAVHAEEVAEVGILHLQKHVSYSSAENIPFSSGDSHVNNAVIRVEKAVNKTKTKREGKSKSRTGDANPMCNISKGLVCNEITLKDGLKLKLDDISEIVDGDPDPIANFKSSDMDSHVQRVQEDKLTASGKEFVGSQDNPNILKGRESNLSPGAPSEFVEKEAPRLQSSDMDSDVQVDHENIWTDSGSELRRTKSPNFSAFNVGRCPVKTEKNVSGKYKSKYFKKQIDGGSSHDEAKLIESTRTVKIKENNINQSIGKLPNSKGDADNRTANQEVEQSSWNNVYVEQLIDNCTPVEEGPQSHISEFGDIGCKRRGRPSKSDTNSRNVYSRASGDILCDKGTVMDGISNNSDGKELKDMTDCELHQEITPKRRRGKEPVNTEENVPKRYKRTKESKKKIDCGGSLDDAKLVESTGTVNIGDCNANKTIGRFPDPEGDADLRADNQEFEQSIQNKVHLEQLINNCTPVERTLETEIPISEFAVTGSKRRIEIPSKPNTRRNINSRNAYSEASRDMLCDKASTMDGRKNYSDFKNMIRCEELHQEITPTWPFDKACKGTDQTVHAEEVPEVGILHFQKHVSFSSAENIPFSSGDSHINNDVIRVEKALNKTKTKREGKSKSRTGDANPMCNISKGLVCNEIAVKDGLKLKLDDIIEIVDGDPNPVAVEIEHDIFAEHDTELGVDLEKETINKDTDSLQTQKNGTERTKSTLIGKRQSPHLRIPPPLPPSRVQTTPEEVSKAFGLKTSRSGRILVPPLAHWCNQTIAYDWDGGIIAIFDGSADEKDDDGSCSFKPPKQAEAIRAQRKLCNAAKKLPGTRNLRSQVPKEISNTCLQ